MGQSRLCFGCHRQLPDDRRGRAGVGVTQERRQMTSWAMGRLWPLCFDCQQKAAEADCPPIEVGGPEVRHMTPD